MFQFKDKEGVPGEKFWLIVILANIHSLNTKEPKCILRKVKIFTFEVWKLNCSNTLQCIPMGIHSFTRRFEGFHFWGGMQISNGYSEVVEKDKSMGSFAYDSMIYKLQNGVLEVWYVPFFFLNMLFLTSDSEFLHFILKLVFKVE